MDLYTFVSWSLTVIAVVTLLWPLNLPLMALAYKVRQGSRTIDVEPGEFWIRSTLASLGLALLTLLALALLYLTVEVLEFREAKNPVRVALLLAYVPAAAGYLFWMYAFDDFFEALSVFVIYLLLPAGPVLLVGWLFGLWRLLARALPWLLSYPC